MRVLIADDSIMVCRRLTALLGGLEGVDIVGQAHSAPDAIASITELRPEAVILDIQMPGGTGMDVLQKAKEAIPDSIVIMLTNYSRPPYRKKYMEAGADFFFDKSTEFEKVIGVFHQLSEPVS